MEQNEAVPPSAEDDDQGQFEVTGDEATARWREVRLQFYLGFAIILIGLLAGVLWHRSLEQMTWIGFGLGAGSLALLVWKHDLIGFSYNKSGDEVSFTARRLPVRREVAAPALLIAAVLLLLAGTSTGFGRLLASFFGVLKTLYDAGGSVVGLIISPVVLVIMLVFAATGLWFVGRGVFYVLRFIVRGFQPDPVEGLGLDSLLFGIIIVAVMALVGYSVVHYSDYYTDEILGPLRTVWGWFQ
jgi:hypothetical protein